MAKKTVYHVRLDEEVVQAVKHLAVSTKRSQGAGIEKLFHFFMQHLKPAAQSQEKFGCHRSVQKKHEPCLMAGNEGARGAEISTANGSKTNRTMLLSCACTRLPEDLETAND